MDFFDIQNVSYADNGTLRNKSATIIQSKWRMCTTQKLYKQTLSIRQSEKKRVFSEIDESTQFVNATMKLNRFELRRLLKLIGENFELEICCRQELRGGLSCFRF